LNIFMWFLVPSKIASNSPFCSHERPDYIVQQVKSNLSYIKNNVKNT